MCGQLSTLRGPIFYWSRLEGTATPCKECLAGLEEAFKHPRAWAQLGLGNAGIHEVEVDFTPGDDRYVQRLGEKVAAEALKWWVSQGGGELPYYQVWIGYYDGAEEIHAFLVHGEEAARGVGIEFIAEQCRLTGRATLLRRG
jgi:hypothetical protein